jgi:hypothetical protein
MCVDSVMRIGYLIFLIEFKVSLDLLAKVFILTELEVSALNISSVVALRRRFESRTTMMKN